NAVEKLGELYRESPVQVSGPLSKPFNLTVTREGCELSEMIALYNAQDYAQTARSDALVEKLFQHATPSGYGDVRSQTTRSDHAVREIPSSEFHVTTALLQAIQEA
ncbi:hypothetical protein OF83DRAFT_1133614, partial [Amylostereum chailletii]